MIEFIKINIINEHENPHVFYVFQQPSIYNGGVEVYSNSLFSTMILPGSEGDNVCTFLINKQILAGVQQRYTPIQNGQPSGDTLAIQELKLTGPKGGYRGNGTQMFTEPEVGLKKPHDALGAPESGFRITSSSFSSHLYQYNGGFAISLPSGEVVLSNFVDVPPFRHVDCNPFFKFYVQTGNSPSPSPFAAGNVIDFAKSSTKAALCDATNGFNSFNVTYKRDGTWNVVSRLSRVKLQYEKNGNITLSK